MDGKQLIRRMHAAAFVAAAMVIAIVVVQLGTLQAIDQEALVEKSVQRQTKRGMLLDRYGEPITWWESVDVTDAQGETTTRVQYHSADSAFQPLMGMVQGGGVASGGIEQRYNDRLLTPVPKTYCALDLQLTLDAALQRKAYELLQTQAPKAKGTGDAQTAMVVLNADTGEVLVCVSNPSYDPATLSSEMDNLKPNAMYNLAAAPQVPGSVFKLITAHGIMEAGLDAEVYDDSGPLFVGGRELKNYGGRRYGKLNFTTAIEKSVNTYFSAKALELGAAAYEKTLHRFHIGEDIKLDFATLKSNYDVSTEFDLAQSAFGQGRTTLSAVHLSIITASIANGGTWRNAHLLPDAPVAEEQVYTQEQCDKLTVGMKQAAESRADSKGRGLAVKTGTADLTDEPNGPNNAWITGFFEHDDHRYAITIVALGTDRQVGATLSPLLAAMQSSIKMSRPSTGEEG